MCVRTREGVYRRVKKKEREEVARWNARLDDRPFTPLQSRPTLLYVVQGPAFGVLRAAASTKVRGVEFSLACQSPGFGRLVYTTKK